MAYDIRPHKFANNAYGLLAADITSGALSFDVTSAPGAIWPAVLAGEIFKLVVVHKTTGVREIMHCTAKSGGTFTVERGREDTSAQAFVAGSFVQHCITAGTLEWFEAQV